VDSAFTVKLQRQDGTTITVEVAPAPAVTFAGGPATLTVGQDVSARVRLQQRLVVADRMTSLGMLGAGVAHEINNPLAYALLNVELAIRDVGRLDDAPPTLRPSLETALEGLGRVRAIVEDLKTLARPDGERAVPTDVNAVLESTLVLAANEIARRARVVRSYGDVPPALASPPRLGQVVLNLVLNAVESMDETNRDANELRVRTFTDDRNAVTIEIEDTGAGIAPEVLGHIFDPFFTTKPVGRGTGLGLAICHQIISDFGGDITVRSTAGCGSTFRMALPSALRLPSVEAGTPVTAGAPSTRRTRVLVVDDELLILDVVRAALENEDVASATSGDEALALLASDASFDVILCDLMMAGMTGMDLYDTLLARHPELVGRVVFMTGGASTPTARDFLERVPDRRLDKPFTHAELARIVGRVAARDTT
jgi:signal transduction histidine kinase